VRALASLILDGVFEFEQSGSSRSGPAAAGLLATRRIPRPASRLGASATSDRLRGRASGLTRHEVRCGCILFTAGRPRRLFIVDFDTTSAAGVSCSRASDFAARLQSNWNWRRNAGRCWLMSQRREPPQAALYPLYVSPTLEHLPRVVRRRRRLSAVRCTRFKVGLVSTAYASRQAVGLFFVLSTACNMRRADRASAAARTSQGVPFTASDRSGGAAVPGGLGAWTRPGSSEFRAWHGIQSWRQWLTARSGVRADGREAWCGPLVRPQMRLELDGVRPALPGNPDHGDLARHPSAPETGGCLTTRQLVFGGTLQMLPVRTAGGLCAAKFDARR